MNKSLLALVLVAVATIGGGLYNVQNETKEHQQLFEEWQRKIGENF
jgi:hypothetical protein